jgi:putative transposase
METNREEQRWNFVMALQTGQWSMTELCERCGVSRPTGYKWLRRADEGTPGFVDRSRAPARCPHRTPASVERQILKLRDQYGWGAKKLIQVLERRHPEIARPARSTVNAILDRHGRLRKNRRRRRRWEHPGAAALGTDRPNQIWPADFKGHFKTQDGKYCYPLTVTDHDSRRLLACRALPSPRTKGTMASLPTTPAT